MSHPSAIDQLLACEKGRDAAFAKARAALTAWENIHCYHRKAWPKLKRTCRCSWCRACRASKAARTAMDKAQGRT
jgi:hypothetical protein